MMKKIIKFVLFILVITIICSFTASVYADDSIIGSGVVDLLKDKSKDADVSDTTEQLSTSTGKMIKLIRNISVILTVVVISFLGIRYMFGSAEEKAGYQKSFLPLLIGVVIITSAVSITELVWNINQECDHNYPATDLGDGTHKCSNCGKAVPHHFVRYVNGPGLAECPNCKAHYTVH